MAEKSFPLFHRAQQVNQPDLQHGLSSGPLEALGQLIEALFVGPDNGPILLWGFDHALSAGNTVITLTRGAAITGYRENGRLVRGAVITAGPASKSLNISTLPDGTYGLYVRLSMRPTRMRSRRFWDALGSPAGEVSSLVHTRIAEDWDFVIERSNPGEEYLRLRTVTIAGGAVTGATHTLRRLWDGRLESNRIITDDEWGGGDDRSEVGTDGPHIPIQSAARWTAMVMRQLQDVIGADFFGSDPKGGDAATGDGPRSLTQLNAEKLAKNGSQDVTGTLQPSATNTHSLGATARRWANVFTQLLDVNGLATFRDELLALSNIALGTTTADATRGRITRTTVSGSARVDVEAGSSSEGTVRLRALSTNLARSCAGQQGLYFETITFDLDTAEIAAHTGQTETITLSASTAVNVGDKVLSCNQRVGSPAYLTDSQCAIVDAVITGSNTLSLTVRNLAGTAQPIAPRTFEFDLVVLRKVTG